MPKKKSQPKKPELTPEQEAFKLRLLQVKTAVKFAQAELDRLRDTCPHMIVSRHESAYCAVCGEGFGWSCPNSPDKCCHYYTVKGFVELINGEKVKPADDHDSNFETDDSCIFCGDPEERK